MKYASAVDLGGLSYDSFGTKLEGRNWQAGIEYRYGFNGKENENDLFGNGNAIDFGDRIFDSRLGRWLKVDGYFKIYPSYSPYTFSINNPINIIDRNGNTIVPFNEYTNDQLGQHFIRVFNAETAKLLTSNLSMDATQKTITKKEFKQAIKGMSTDQKALARGYFKMINSEKLVLYAFGKKDDIVPEEALLDQHSRQYSGKTFGDVSTGSGGLSPYPLPYEESKYCASVIVQTDGNVTFGDSGYFSSMNKDGAAGFYDDSADGFDESLTSDGSKDVDAVVIHEGLGHALFQGILGASYKAGQFASIQVENIYRRIKGYDQRSGVEDHYTEVEQVVGTDIGKPAKNATGEKVTEIPTQLTK